MDTRKLEKIIRNVQKPSQYIGGELNSIDKSQIDIDISVALVFPDLYEMGLSNFGLKILYDVINRKDYASAERFYSPDLDFSEQLLSEGEPLRSLDTGKPISSFDIIGFTLQYELSYTNILTILKQNNIPLYALDRDDTFPLIIGGGPCSFNPEPVADFFDLFVLGDGEEVIEEIINVCRNAKQKNLSREETLRKLSQCEGIYIPSFFSVSYSTEGKLSSITPENGTRPFVLKRTVESLDTAPYPVKQIVPFTNLVHDRISLEIDRGCTHGCRFCQAGIINRPVRERSMDTISNLLDQTIAMTGHDEVSLGSLSAGDYSAIQPLLCNLIDKYSNSSTSFSFPSLRPDTLTEELIIEVGKGRKSGFTIAAEAGTQRLRDSINKKISDEDIFKAIGFLAKEGWDSLKLYFMIGLPSETEEDITGIVELCQNILKRERKIRKLTVSVSSFIPKAHTPFQWSPQKSITYIEEVQKTLRTALGKNRRISLKWHDSGMSFLEAVFARGDRRLSKVIEKAVEKGCCFDGWGDRFNFAKWKEAFTECEISPELYAEHTFKKNDTLPWDHLHTGVSKEFLRDEFERSFQGELSEDCRRGKCSSCGLTVGKCIDRKPQLPRVEPSNRPKEIISIQKRFRYRTKYIKTGMASYLSHLEVGRVFHRAIRRAKLPLLYSQGFHPHPKIAFGFALPVGVASESEYVDIELSSHVEAGLIEQTLNNELPPGIGVENISQIDLKASAISQDTQGMIFSIKVTDPDPETFQKKLMGFQEHSEIWIEKIKKRKVKKINIIPYINDLKITVVEDEELTIELEVIRVGDSLLKPQEILCGIMRNECTEKQLIIKKIETVWKK